MNTPERSGTAREAPSTSRDGSTVGAQPAARLSHLDAIADVVLAYRPKAPDDAMVEGCARAICAKRFNNRDVHEWNDLPDDFRALYLDDAQAAIAFLTPLIVEKVALRVAALGADNDDPNVVYRAGFSWALEQAIAAIRRGE